MLNVLHPLVELVHRDADWQASQVVVFSLTS